MGGRTTVYVPALTHLGAAPCFPGPAHESYALFWRSPMRLRTYVYLWSSLGISTRLLYLHQGAAQLYMFLRLPTGGLRSVFLRPPTGAAFYYGALPWGCILVCICGRPMRGSTMFSHSPREAAQIYVPALAHWETALCYFLRSPIGAALCSGARPWGCALICI